MFHRKERYGKWDDRVPKNNAARVGQNPRGTLITRIAVMQRLGLLLIGG
jgi:hypothetical protein